MNMRIEAHGHDLANGCVPSSKGRQDPDGS